MSPKVGKRRWRADFRHGTWRSSTLRCPDPPRSGSTAKHRGVCGDVPVSRVAKATSAGRGGCRASVAARDARRPSTCATRDDSKPVSARGLNRGELRSLGRSVRLPNSARSFGGRAGSLRHSRRRSQGRDVDRRVVNLQYTDDWCRTLRRVPDSTERCISRTAGAQQRPPS